MRIQQRGRFKTVVHDDSSTIQYICRGILQHIKDDIYCHLRIDSPEMIQNIEEIDAFIRKHQPLPFSPWLQGAQTLVLKKAARCVMCDDSVIGQEVEVDIRLGNFGSFGYCWLVHKIFLL
jgi:hypothetical protein